MTYRSLLVVWLIAGIYKAPVPLCGSAGVIWTVLSVPRTQVARLDAVCGKH